MCLVPLVSFLLGAQKALLSCCGIDECELTDTLSVDAQTLDKHSVLVTQKGCLRLTAYDQLLKGSTRYTRTFYPVSWLMRGPAQSPHAQNLNNRLCPVLRGSS